ncbi:MAG TPA: Nif3-like dinuclear metal center hexameric protein, partial [Phnomibacter sp.]|nr:Nif3-like dinuclear metal center hexameric protein [Phnomibacter sp.]
VIFPKHLYQRVINALHKAHPYETVAYQVVKIENNWEQVGSGAVGHLPTPMSQPDFLNWLCQTFKLPVVKHTLGRQKIISKVALCGGTGFFLLRKAIAAGADAFITSDLKYHEYFEADGQLLLADIGHFESEQYTIELLQTFLQANFPTFAVLKAEVGTNPVHYFLPG